MCEGIVPGEMHHHHHPHHPHHHVGASSPHGRPTLLTATAAAAAGASTAETTMDLTMQDERVPVVGNCAGRDDLKKVCVVDSMPQQEDPCFPGCMGMPTDTGSTNQKVVRVVERSDDAPDNGTNDESPVMAMPSGRRSRRNSRRLSMDNQSENGAAADAHVDLEDVARGVLSPVDFRSQVPAPGSIVVDYDEGMPERSRTGLLLRDQRTADTDCAPDACNPLDAFSFAFDELAIEDMATPGRIAGRPRLGSASQPKTPRTPKTPNRRGKSVVLSATAITLEVEKPLAAVGFPTAVVATVIKPQPENIDDDEEAVERCSKLHKLCLCEVRLHKSRESCWLVAFDSVYDVTGLVDVHPAGPRSILRKAGGPDCTKDMKFHSKAARKMMEKCFIGKLVPCGEDPEEADAPAACTIM